MTTLFFFCWKRIKTNIAYIFFYLFNLAKPILEHVKLMKGKALRKHSLHEKTAASVLLKLFISGNKINKNIVVFYHLPFIFRPQQGRHNECLQIIDSLDRHWNRRANCVKIQWIRIPYNWLYVAHVFQIITKSNKTWLWNTFFIDVLIKLQLLF